MMRLMTNIIIAAYAGTGKTTLANKYPNIFVDLECMPYKYSDREKPFDESCKANFDYELNDEWPYNYIDAIKNFPDKTKIILIPPDLYVLGLLMTDNISYYICYPERNAKEEYRKRFIERGNTDAFIDIFIGGWDRFITSFENNKFGERIILKQNEYLEDVCQSFFWIPDNAKKAKALADQEFPNEKW